MLNQSTTRSLQRLAPARNAVLSWLGSKHGHRPDLATPNRLPPPRRGAAGAYPGGGSAVTAPCPSTRRSPSASPQPPVHLGPRSSLLQGGSSHVQPGGSESRADSDRRAVPPLVRGAPRVRAAAVGAHPEDIAVPG